VIDFRPWHRTKPSGASHLFHTGDTPFLCLLSFITVISLPVWAAQDAIQVESLSEESPAGAAIVTETVPFQTPVEEVTESPAGGIEGQYQLQLLQNEVMELRGLMEELNHQIERMQATQEDRYLELDGRFQDLLEERGTGGGGSNVGSGAGPVLATGGTAGQDEKTLYETALELIRNRQYELAITQLQAVIAQYPDGGYAPNAYYWLGEVYAAKPEPDYDNARKALAQVITFFPDHRKVPDAAFKLGKVYHLIGDCDRATDLLNEVIEQQQGKSVAKLAESYLRDKVRCE
jgi:tol-pal system protein YbgF